MPSLPLLISLLISKERRRNQDKESQEANSNEGLPNDHRIDMLKESNEGSTNERTEEMEKESRVEAPTSRRHKAIHATYALSRRVLLSIRKFIFVGHKSSKERYAPKYRWLPILSGIIVPFSILLEVPGLTEHWYVRTMGTEVVEYRSNPAILDVGLGLSMFSAVLANLCLVLRFLERRIKGGTLAAIFFLTIHDIINIVTLAIFGIAHRFDDGFTYSQAYWVTFASTITSLFVTVTLLIDYVRTPDFSNSGSGVTRKQRSLIIIVMILLTYLGIGAMAYSFMLDYPFLDALYFCVCSSLTIGFGDISPSTTGSQAFSIFYNTFGILNTGLAIAIARETIVEAFEQTYRERRHALTMRRKAHRELKAKSHLLKHSLWHAGQKINDHAPSPFELPVSDMPPISDSDTTSQKNGKGSGQQEKAKVLQGESEEKQANQKGKQAANRPDLWQKATLASLVSEKDSPTAFIEEEQQATAAIQDQTDKLHDQMKKFDSNMVSGFGDEEKEYVQFRQNIIKEEKKEFRAKLYVSWGLFGTFWFSGGIIFMLSEGWSYGTAIYFCFTAFSTIGYGDIAPRTGPGRVCFIAWSLLGVGAMTIFISVLSEAYQSRYSNVMHSGVFDKTIRNYQNRARSLKHTNGTKTGDPETPTYDDKTMTVEARRQALDDTKVEISSLPPKVVGHAKALHTHLQYVLSHSSTEALPPGLQRALDELMDEEKMNENLRKEVLDDSEARRTLYMMSFERTLKKMVEHVERISNLIEQRDMLEDRLGFKKYVEELDEEVEEQQEEENAAAEGVDNAKGGRPLLRPGGSRNIVERGHKNWGKLRAGFLGSLAPRHSLRRNHYEDEGHSEAQLSKDSLSQAEGEGKRLSESNEGMGSNLNEDAQPELHRALTKSRWDELLKRAGTSKVPTGRLSGAGFADDPYDENADSARNARGAS